MKKICILISLFTFSSFFLFAQDPITGGVKVGLGLVKNFFVEDDRVYNLKAVDSVTVNMKDDRGAIEAGMWGRFPLYPFYLEPSLIVSLTPNSAQYEEVANSKFNYLSGKIEVPINAGFKIWIFRASAGLVPAVPLFRGKFFKYDTWNGMFNDFSLDWQLGGGIDIGKKLIADFRMQRSMTKSNEAFDADEVRAEIPYKATKISISLGYVFGKHHLDQEKRARRKAKKQQNN